MTDSRLKYLTWTDVLILTLLLFGMPIYRSTVAFLWPVAGDTGEALTRSDWSNYYSLLIQAFSLLVVLLYLWWRGFDFSQWSFKVTGKGILLGLGLFILLAGLTDVYYLILSPDHRDYYLHVPLNLAGVAAKLTGNLSLSAVLYALLNGVYEEIYFLGMCLSVKKEQRVLVWLFSLVVRFSFHTYQGLLSATAIALILGIFYYVWYDRLGKRNLFPIFLSHALADIWGLGLLYYLLG